MHVSFTNRAPNIGDILVVPFFTGNKGGENFRALDPTIQRTAAMALSSDIRFKGAAGQVLTVPVLPSTGYKKLMLVGVGPHENMTPDRAEALGSRILQSARETGLHRITIFAEDLQGADHTLAADIANGFFLKSYKFNKYKTNTNPDEPVPVLRMVQADPVAAHAKFERLAAVSRGAFLARNLANEPPNVLFPDMMAHWVRAAVEPLGVKVTILNERDLAKLGMNAHLAVGQGSPNKPRLVVMEYDGTDGSRGKPLALVGKGVTFDTGGVSLKTNMENMKMDMSGAGAVAGTIAALAGRKANVKIVGILGLAENDIGSMAYKVDDIITTMSGKTVEIKNTDAEGRLVLCDALTYVQRNHKPHTIIDVATLTGACKAALGSTMCGVFSNDDRLAAKIQSSGNKVGERGWRLPLGQEFNAALNSWSADLQNIGNGGPGASTAAAFLQSFIEGKTKWAHLDIAGTAYGVSGHPTLPDRIGNGFGVRLLDRLVADHFEKRPRKPKAAPAAGPA